MKCTHSATIGKVDPEQLFYLQSRGIGTQTATNLIVEGFFESILSKIEDKKTKEKLVQKINNLLC